MDISPLRLHLCRLELTQNRKTNYCLKFGKAYKDKNHLKKCFPVKSTSDIDKLHQDERRWVKEFTDKRIIMELDLRVVMTECNIPLKIYDNVSNVLTRYGHTVFASLDRNIAFSPSCHAPFAQDESSSSEPGVSWRCGLLCSSRQMWRLFQRFGEMLNGCNWDEKQHRCNEALYGIPRVVCTDNRWRIEHSSKLCNFVEAAQCWSTKENCPRAAKNVAHMIDPSTRPVSLTAKNVAHMIDPSTRPVSLTRYANSFFV